MTVYLGDKAVGANTIVEKEVAKTKYGASIDNFLGDINENGIYVAPTEPIEVNLVGVKGFTSFAFADKFRSTYAPVKIKINDATTFGIGTFSGVFHSAKSPVEFEACAVEEFSSSQDRTFEYAFSTEQLVSAKFSKLKKLAGQKIFYGAFNKKPIVADKVFPLLDDISGSNIFNELAHKAGQIITFSKVKKITGTSSVYQSTFGNCYFNSTVWNFPSATEFVGYIWNITVSYTSEIHFAAANQVAIEACDGYANKWGNAGATIYFDLMLTITVNGVAYEREHTIDGYTSWKDASGNLVYTDATAEPAVGTVVYSDAGTTQVGTVEGVA